MKFLIVDDNPDYRALIVGELQKTFPDAEIVEIFRREDFVAAVALGDFDAVITECRLGWGDGLWVLGTVRGRVPDAPVVMVTDAKSEEVAVAGVRVGLSDYVLKERLRRLPMAVRESLEKARLRAEQRRVEEALRESEAMFQDLFESAPDAIVFVHSDGHIVRVNARAETMFGYSRDELPGSPVEVLIPERFRELHLRHRRGYISEPRPRPMGSGLQLYGRRRDGSEFPVDIMLIPLETKDGIQVINVVRDVTERRRAEETLRRQQDELATRARIVSAILHTHDLDERLNIILDEAMNLLGVEFGGVHLVERDRVILRAWRGISDEFRAHVTSCPVEQAPDWMKTMHVVHEWLSERSATPDFAKREGMQAWVCVPLAIPQRSADGMEQSRWVGTLMLGSRRYDALRGDDVQVLQSLSEQLALAIDHARRHREAEERLWRLRVLREIDRAIIVKHSTRDVLKVVLERVPKELGGDAVAVSLLDEDRLGSRVFVMRLPNGAVVEEEAFVLSESLIHWFVERREPVIIYDLMKDLRLQMHRERIRDHNLVSYLGVPLVAQERTIGILHLLTTQPRIFSEEDVDFFHTLAGQAAIAIESVLLLDRVRASEARFRRLAENAHDLIYRYRFTPSRGFEYVSPAATAITGYTPEEHYADPDLGFKLVHPDDRPLLEAAARSPSSAGNSVTLRWIRKDGAIVWTEQRNVPIYDEAGNLIALEGVARDVTERRQTEETLRESEDKYRRIVENIDEIIYTVALEDDPFGEKVQFVSSRVKEVIGYQPDEFIQNPGLWFQLVHPDDVPALMETTRKIVAHRGAGVREYRVRCKEKAEYRWVEDRVVPQMDSHGNVIGTFGVARDITERKRAEEALRQAMEQTQVLARRLVDAQEDERRRIARELHDEIGQTLTAANINLRAIRRQHDAFAPGLGECIAVLENTIQQVRDLSLMLRPSQLDDLGLAAALRWYVDRWAKRMELSVQLDIDPVEMRLSSDVETACFRVSQEALTNVARHAQARQICVELRQQDADLRLIVRDDGVGFGVDAALRRAADGASLGLLSMQERARLVGGEVEITSAPGRGTEVRARFPVGRET